MTVPQRFAAFFFALAVLAATGCASTATRNSPGGYVDDALITTKVKAAMLEEPNLEATEIKVKTLKGTVQLSGFVDTQAAIARAGAVAQEVEGVKAVKNDLLLKP